MKHVEWASTVIFSGVALVSAAIPLLFAHRATGHHLTGGLRAVLSYLFA